MDPTTVLHLLDLLTAAGVQTWLDGGWCIDALLGRITRTHDDLDLVLALADLPRAVDLLTGDGLVIAEEEIGRVVLVGNAQGRVDLHPVTFDTEGNGRQVQPAEVPLVYSKEGFVTGSILGRPVACISVQVQLAVRLGYDRSRKHYNDAIVLCEEYGLELPEVWRSFAA